MKAWAIVCNNGLWVDVFFNEANAKETELRWGADKICKIIPVLIVPVEEE